MDEINTLAFGLASIAMGVIALVFRKKTIRGSNQRGALPMKYQERVALIVCSLLIGMGVVSLIVGLTGR